MKRLFAILTVLVVLLAVALVVRLRQMQQHLRAPAGGSATIEGTEVDLTSRLNARIVAIHADEGDHVEQGAVLVQLDCAEPQALVAEAQARVAMAEFSAQAASASSKAAAGNALAARQSASAHWAQAQALAAQRYNAERDATRLGDLFQTGSATPAQYDQINTLVKQFTGQEQALLASHKAALAQADSAYRNQLAVLAQSESARAGIDAARALLERAKIQAAECNLAAPRTGYVLRRNYEPGELALPGSKILTLVDTREVKATFYIPNAELAAAAPRRAVRVVADAYPGQVFTGKIRSVASEAEFTPRNIQTREDRDRLVYAVEIVVPNADNRLRPGMPVDIAIEGTGR